MKGFLDDDRDLEVDPLTDGKPVEFVPQHRSDMVELPLVEDRLQSSHDNVCLNDSFEIKWNITIFVFFYL